MDPVGPWSAYASYNHHRLAAAQTGSGAAADLHHHLAAAAAAGGGSAPTSTTSVTSGQILPGSFLSPPPVGYETVFSPLFHTAAKPPSAAAHYVAQHHRTSTTSGGSSTTTSTTKQTSDSDSTSAYHQSSTFFEQNAGPTWQQNSPFGILPHESVVAAAAASAVSSTTTKTSTSPYENFNPHFLNSQLVAAKAVAASAAAASAVASANRAQSPQQQQATASNKTNFFQENPTKSFNCNSNQSCIVSSPNSSVTVRVPQRAFLNSPNQQQNKQPSPPTNKANNIKEETQSSPISFSMDTANRLNYNNSATSKRNFQQHNYNRYQSNEDFRSNSTTVPASTPTNPPPANGLDCSNGGGVVVPRRPSPLQAHSQASPLGHVPSPAYPMYHSPMNSISSPQQVTPPSPLDASIPRSQNNVNVAYPSVITRTQQQQQQQQQQTITSCWEDRATNRKYTGAQYNSAVDGRQYFDNNQSLQDLTSCRGDPMSIVKNLQQQSCQLSQQLDIKQEVKPPAVKRRKSTDTGKMSDRIPPPAHSSQPQQQQQQQQQPQQQQQQQQQQTQQQNGSYFDFDRWNLQPSSKIFHQQQQTPQHQGLMLNHPPLPYFAPFLPPHHPEFQAVGMEPSYDHYPQQNPHHHHQHHHQQQQQPQHQQQQQQQHPQPPPPQEDQIKVVVPNIEEELNFLSQDTVSSSTTTRRTSGNSAMPINKPPIPNSKTIDKNGAGSGFMSSYLKFLQGERDNSPPPPTRYAPKKSQNWINNNNKKDVKIESNNGTTIKPTLPPPIPKPPTRLSTHGDPQDDPRYFPLPKERKRDSFDSSDDGISSDDDFFGNNNNKKSSSSSSSSSQIIIKSGACKNSTSNAIRKCKTKSLAAVGGSEQKRQRKKDVMEKKDIENIPRRESVKRAAKEKNNLQNLIKINNDDDLEEPPEFQDSDSDPAWTPQAKEDGDDILPVQGKKPKRNRTRQKKKTRNLITAAAQGAGIREIDGYSSSDTIGGKQKKQKNKHAPTLEDNLAAAIPNSSSSTTTTTTNSIVANDEFPYKPGEFVAIKSELNQNWPAIWRVDGKTLLQKYEPFNQNGITLYRNISTYTSWTPESKKQYVSIPTKCKLQTQNEVIVEFLKDEMTIIDEEFNEKCMNELKMYQDNFEVYIQTLISQALDSNFLTEIFQEKDEYFLSNVKTVDDITDSKKRKLLNLLRWPPSVQAAVCTWPLFNVIGEIGNAIDLNRRTNCGACGKFEVAVRVLMYGQPYNSTTLEGCPPDPKAMNEKDFLMCRICSTRVELANKVTHQKYLMYIECAKRVSEKRTSDPSKDTTCILNELLADESWLNKLFFEVRTTWAEIECIEYSFKLKNNSQCL